VAGRSACRLSWRIKEEPTLYTRYARDLATLMSVLVGQVLPCLLQAAFRKPSATDVAQAQLRHHRWGATEILEFARFYFDFHDASGILRDEAGEELPSATIARNDALKTVGQAVKDLTYRHADGRVVIEVRDGDGPVLRVLAVVETTSLKE
jgi:hypothetical protein